MNEASLEQFVTDQFEAGHFENYERLVAERLLLLREGEAEPDRLVKDFQPVMERIEQGDPGAEVNIEKIKALGRKYLYQRIS